MGVRPFQGPIEQGPKPRWLKVPLPGGPGYIATKRRLIEGGLNTICVEARCPNAGECWQRGTASFLLMGRTCTRACRYCDVDSGRPEPLDPGEPERLAVTASRLGLGYVVVTSVTRDDLPDGGAAHFAATIRAAHARGMRIEVLIPDFKNKPGALETVLEARPDVLAHNIEIVERLYPSMRPGGSYRLALNVLARAATIAAAMPTLGTGARPGETPPLVKSSLIVGLGETPPEITQTLHDLRAARCDVVTLGQYLRPSPHHAPVDRYIAPEEFARMAQEARTLGFRHVVSGPLVRSSYLAERAFHAVPAATVEAGIGPFTA